MFEKYDAYKDSEIQWIGQIPEHWEIEKAKWIFLKADRPIRPNDGIVTCFRDGEVTLRSNRRTDGFTNALKEHGYQGIRKGDLVIHAMDAFAGAIGVSDSDGKSTPVYSACIPRIKNRINVHYYAYYLRNLALAGFIESLAKGIRERSTDFRFADFAELLLPFPKLEDQERIVAFLNQKTAEIDQAIAIKEQQIALLNERKQIVIQKAVTQGLDPNVPMKDSGVEWIGQIPEHWNTITKLKHIASLKGRQGWQGLKADEYIDEGPYVVSSAHFDGLDINWDKCPHVSIERYKMDAHIQLNIGDILLMKDGAKMGKMAYISNLPDLACLNSHLLLIRSLKTQDEFFFDSKYMLYFMLSEKFQDYVQVKGTGTTFMGISQESIGNFPIALPSLEEQVQITSFLDKRMLELEKGKDLLLTQIEKLKEYKTTLINDAVTGKIKVA